MITMYTTGCPLCVDLKRKLDAKGIQYRENRSLDDMRRLGLTHVPMLDVAGALLDYPAAIKWIKETI